MYMQNHQQRLRENSTLYIMYVALTTKLIICFYICPLFMTCDIQISIKDIYTAANYTVHLVE